MAAIHPHSSTLVVRGFFPLFVLFNLLDWCSWLFFWLCFLVSSFRLRSPLACSLAFLESWTSWPLSVFRLLFRHRPPPHLRVRSLSPFYWKGLVIPHPTSRPLSSLCPLDLFISTIVQATATPTLPQSVIYLGRPSVLTSSLFPLSVPPPFPHSYIITSHSASSSSRSPPSPTSHIRILVFELASPSSTTTCQPKPCQPS